MPNNNLHTETAASNEELVLPEQNVSDLNSATDTSLLWRLPSRRDRVIQIRISRNTLIAFVFSIIIHLLLLITLAPKLLELSGSTAKQDKSFDVQLTLPSPNVAQSPAVSAPETLPAKPQPIQKNKKQTLNKPTPNPKPLPNTPANPDVMAVEKPHTPLTKPPMTPALTHNAPATSTEPLPGEDMQSYIKRQKEQRQAAQGYTQKDSDEVNARNNAPIGDEEKRTTNIQNNLQQKEGQAVVGITELSLNTARVTFMFRKNDYSKAEQLDFDVKVPIGGDIQRAVVKKMIAMLHEKFPNVNEIDFTSTRLRRVFPISLRPADNAGLEDLLIREYFDDQGRVIH